MAASGKVCSLKGSDMKQTKLAAIPTFCVFVFIAACVLPALAGLVPEARADSMDDANAAVRAQEQGRLDEAMELYTRAIDSGELPDGDNLLSYLYNNRGLIWVKRKEYDKALQDFDAAISHKKDYIFYFNKGRLLMEQGKDQEAIAAFTQTLMKKPDFTRAFHARGLAKLNTGDVEGGLADLKQAKQSFPFLETRGE